MFKKNENGLYWTRKEAIVMDWKYCDWKISNCKGVYWKRHDWEGLNWKELNGKRDRLN